MVWDVLGFCCLWAIWVGGWTPWESDLRGLPEGPRWWRWKPPLLLESAPPPPPPRQKAARPLAAWSARGRLCWQGLSPRLPRGTVKLQGGSTLLPAGQSLSPALHAQHGGQAAGGSHTLSRHAGGQACRLSVLP